MAGKSVETRDRAARAPLDLVLMHIRQQIREAFIARLSGIRGVKKIGGAQAFPYGDEQIPAIQVITTNETIEPLDNSSTETYRRIGVDVVITTKGNDKVDDKLDAIAAQVETLILTATGEPWNTLVMHFPTAATLAVGDPAEQTRFALTTRFDVVCSATNAETIG